MSIADSTSEMSPERGVREGSTEIVGRSKADEGSISMSLTVSMLSWDPAASAAEGGVGTSSSSMGEGTSNSSPEVAVLMFSCGWRCRMCCLVPVRVCKG